MATEEVVQTKRRWIRCELLPGVFPSQLLARFRVEANGGELLTAGFFDREVVRVDVEPDAGRVGSGWLRCAELEKEGDVLLVCLPKPTDHTNQLVVVRVIDTKEEG